MRPSSRFSLAFFLSFVALAICPSLAAQEATTVPARLTEASLFKNGMAYLVREVDIPGPGLWRVSGIPTPVHGTFWILPATQGLEIKSATALMESTQTHVPETQLYKLLLLNAGRTLEIKTVEGWITGEVMATPQETSVIARETRGSLVSPLNPSRSPVEIPAKDHVLLKTDKGILALHVGDIRGFRLASGSLITEHPDTQSVPAVHVSTTGGKGKIRIWSLTKGLAWAPSYQVDISDPKEAVVRGKAVLINDIEDLKAANVSLIAGFPNLQFGHAVDAFSPAFSLDDFIRGVSEPPRSAGSSVLAQGMVLSNVGSSRSESMDSSRDTAEEATQDLFFHQLHGITLKKGERGYQPMFEHRVPYQHVFVWNIGDSQQDSNRWQEGRSDRDNRATAREEVWHELKLKHTGNVPWSTGPAMTIQQDRILGQDTLNFTPAGGDTQLRITRAMDVTAEQSESETQRLRDAPTPYSGHWDLVTVKGTLQVSNHRGTATRMMIKKDLSGELSTASLKPTSQALPEGLKQVNPRLRLTWEVDVPSKDKVKITYVYKVLVPR